MKNIIIIFVLFCLWFSTTFADVESEEKTENNQKIEAEKLQETDQKTKNTEIEQPQETKKVEEKKEESSENLKTAETMKSGSEKNTTKVIPKFDAQAVTDATYTYYYATGCSHCADLDAFLKKFWGYEKLKITKKEVRGNQENAKAFGKDSERLLGDKNKAGTPFVIAKVGEQEIPLVGTDVVEEFLKPALNTPSEKYIQEQKSAKSKKMITLVVLLLLAGGIPAGLYLLGRKK